jgi:hypothetical protein
MSGVLVLGLHEKAAIEMALKEARANVIPWEVLEGLRLGRRDCRARRTQARI